MFDPPDVFVVRNEFVLRLFMLSALDADDARALAARFGDESAREEARLRDAIDKAGVTDPLGIEYAPVRVAAEYGVRVLGTIREWARWALDRIDRSPPRSGLTGRTAPPV
jgi:hypothetical protein